MIYAGGSGNDLPLLVSSLKAVCVANASPEVGQQAVALAGRNGCADSLNPASQTDAGLERYCNAGGLPGILLFYPKFSEPVEES